MYACECVYSCDMCVKMHVHVCIYDPELCGLKLGKVNWRNCSIEFSCFCYSFLFLLPRIVTLMSFCKVHNSLAFSWFLRLLSFSFAMLFLVFHPFYLYLINIFFYHLSGADSHFLSPISFSLFLWCCLSLPWVYITLLTLHKQESKMIQSITTF